MKSRECEPAVHIVFMEAVQPGTTTANLRAVVNFFRGTDVEIQPDDSVKCRMSAPYIAAMKDHSHDVRVLRIEPALIR